MDRIIAILSHPFTLLIRWNVWQRSGVILALLLLIILLLWRVLAKFMRVVLGTSVKGFYLLFCEFVFHLMQKNAEWTKVQKRNALTMKCELLYDKTQIVKKTHQGLKLAGVILLYAAVLGLIALPFCLGSDTPTDVMPVVSAITNLYHKAEAPILRKSMRTSPAIPVSISSLNDVEQQNPYREGIQFTCSRGLLEYSDGYFHPDDILTREECAVMLYRYSGEPVTSYPANISDMQPGMNTYSAVCWCVEQGILTLEADGSFFRGEQITCEQFLVALARCANTEGLPTSAYFDISTIPGNEDIDDWAIDACKWAAKANILILDSDGYFSAKAPLSREKAAELFFQFSLWENSIA